jgi:hypothetical protein
MYTYTCTYIYTHIHIHIYIYGRTSTWENLWDNNLVVRNKALKLYLYKILHKYESVYIVQLKQCNYLISMEVEHKTTSLCWTQDKSILKGKMNGSVCHTTIAS